MAVLIIKRASVPILQYPLNGHPVRIGRDESSDIHLLGESVSRQHAIITPAEGGYRFENLGRNGTIMDGKKIDSHPLKPGDVLEIADWQLHYLTEACALRTETVIANHATPSRRLQPLPFIGESYLVQAIKEKIERLAQSDAPVCILGPTGSGKEVAAQAIHAGSPRAAGPFVAVNCGAIPPSMIESELFGYEKGAFTGASRDHRGYFAQANRGTLFLDEIGELPLELQTRFLRVLETGTFRKLGGQSQSSADFRIICATHCDLQQAVINGTFREDLFFRLFVLPLTLPPLCDRADDIPLLVEHFSRLFGRGDVAWSSDAIAKLTRHSWPGNVRELKNTVQRSLIMTTSPTLQAAGVYLLPTATEIASQNLMDQERGNIVRILAKYGGNNSRAATELGISRTTLIAKIRRLNISEQDVAQVV